MTDDHPLISLPSRRDALRLGAAGAVTVAGLDTVQKALADCTLNPSQTEWPYWVDEMLSRSDIRSDPGTGVVQQGFPFRLAINVSEITGGISCAPLSGAYVDIWHCNASGIYSDTSAQGTVGQRFLRGYQVTDDHGNVHFLTIYPGYYNGRTVHIHFRVRKFSGMTTTFNFASQFYFNDATTTAIFQRVAPYNSQPARTTTNSNDGLYSAALLLRLSDNGSHAVGSFDVVVNSIPGRPGDGTLPDPDPESLDEYGGGTPPLEAQASSEYPDSAP